MHIYDVSYLRHRYKQLQSIWVHAGRVTPIQAIIYANIKYTRVRAVKFTAHEN